MTVLVTCALGVVTVFVTRALGVVTGGDSCTWCSDCVCNSSSLGVSGPASPSVSREHGEGWGIHPGGVRQPHSWGQAILSTSAVPTPPFQGTASHRLVALQCSSNSIPMYCVTPLSSTAVQFQLLHSKVLRHTLVALQCSSNSIPRYCVTPLSSTAVQFQLLHSKVLRHTA